MRMVVQDMGRKQMKREQGTGKLIILFLLSAALFVLLFSQAVMQADAYTSWVQDTDAYNDFYDNAAIVERIENPPASEEEGFLVQQLGNLIHWIGVEIASCLQSDNLNLTIDGIVFGRIAQPNGISYTSFDLSDGNPYGIAGAMLYIIFRGFSYSGLFLIFLFLLAKSLFSSSSKAMEDLKQGIYGIVLAFAAIYLMPQITDLTLFVRDQFLYLLAQQISGTTSILDSMDAMYQSNRSLITAIVYTASVGAALVYLKEYVSIAVQQALLFGFFCIFNLAGSMKKKLMADWCAVFFTNMLVPLIDVACLMLPYLAIYALSVNGNITFGTACIVMCMIWGAKGCRVQIVRLFGAMTGTPAGRGLGAIAAMGMMVRNAMKNKKPSSQTVKENGNTFHDWADEGDRQKEVGGNMDKHADAIVKKLPDTESLMGMERDHDNTMDETELLGSDYHIPEVKSGDNGSFSEEDSSGKKDSFYCSDDDRNTEEGESLLEDEINHSGTKTENIGDIMEDSDLGPAGPDKENTDLKDRQNEYPCIENTEREEDDSTSGKEESDSEGYAGMSGFERKRYSNLKSLDSLNEEVAELNKENDGLKGGNTDLDLQMQNERNGIRKEDAADQEEIRSIRSANADLDLQIQAAGRENREDIPLLKNRNSELDSMIQDSYSKLQQENDSDKKAIQTLQGDNRDIDQELKGAGEGVKNARREKDDEGMEAWKGEISHLNERKQNNSKQIAMIQNRMADRQMEANEQIAKLKQEKVTNNSQIIRRQQEADDKVALLQNQKTQNNQLIIEAQARMENRQQVSSQKMEELQLLKAQNSRKLEENMSRINQCQRQAAERRDVEAQFAQISRNYGGDGTRYTSSQEMLTAVEVRRQRAEMLLQEAKKNAAVSINDLKGISPEAAAEIANIQKENIRRANLKAAVQKAAAVAGGAGLTAVGAAMGGALFAYGGEEASANGAVAGAALSTGTVHKMNEMGKRFYENRREIAEDIRAGGSAVIGMAESAYQSDKNLFQSGNAMEEQKNHKKMKELHQMIDAERKKYSKKAENEGKPAMQEVIDMTLEEIGGQYQKK